MPGQHFEAKHLIAYLHLHTVFFQLLYLDKNHGIIPLVLKFENPSFVCSPTLVTTQITWRLTTTRRELSAFPMHGDDYCRL